MIELTRLNNEKIVVNADLIEFLERTPDTLVTTSTGKKLMVKETSMRSSKSCHCISPAFPCRSAERRADFADLRQITHPTGRY